MDQVEQAAPPLSSQNRFLATRDVETASRYVEEGLAIVRRMDDQEWSAIMVASAIHVYWTKGEWDTATSLAGERRELEQTTVGALMATYLNVIKVARGEPVEVGSPTSHPLGLRTDLMQNATQLFLDAARARAAGERVTAAERSSAATFAYVESSGLDDDFPVFWVTSLEDAAAAAERETAQRLLDIVGAAPGGHVTPILRAQLLRLRALVAISTGDDADVEPDLLAGIEALDQFGAKFYAACARVEYASWLCGHGRGAEAASLLDEAGATFTALRAAPWLAKVKELSSISVG